MDKDAPPDAQCSLYLRGKPSIINYTTCDKLDLVESGPPTDSEQLNLARLSMSDGHHQRAGWPRPRQEDVFLRGVCIECMTNKVKPILPTGRLSTTSSRRCSGLIVIEKIPLCLE